MSERRLRVVVATPLSETLCALIESREPRIELLRDRSLLPPMRHPADFGGDPDFCRTPAQEARFEALCRRHGTGLPASTGWQRGDALTPAAV